MGEASSQFVFVSGKTAAAGGSELKTAGVTPEELATGEFLLAPLARVSDSIATVLDFASEVAKRDVIPSRPGVMALSIAQSRDLTRSLDALKKLDARLEKKDVENAHCVAYLLAYSTIVNNPSAVENFCVRIAGAARAGVVDTLNVDGLATMADGSEAGKFVVVNCVV
jgi:hypothetical protein